MNTKKGTILIVDDTPANLKLLMATLTKEGYKVLPANSGELALASVAAGQPDLILLDMRMPGMDGFEVCRQLKANAETRDIPVIFISAFGESEERVAGFKLGAVDFISKPFQESELLARVQTHVELRRFRVQSEHHAADLRQANQHLQAEVAERKRAEEVLRESKERFRLLYERAPVGYQSLDENGHFIEVNHAWLNTFGYSREEVIGKSFGDFLHPDWKDHFKENFPRFKAIGEVLGAEFEMVKKDGSFIFVAFNGKIGKDKNGNFQQTHCIFNDITESRRVEDELRKSEEKYRDILESINDCYFEMDLRGNMTFFNTMTPKALGYSPEEMMGMNHRVYIDTENAENVERVFREIYSKDIPSKVIGYEITRKDGTKAHAETSISLIKNKDGHSIGYRGVSRDITNRKQAEESLKESEERFKALHNASFGGIAIHDKGKILECNQGLSEITGYSRDELMRMDGLLLIAEKTRDMVKNNILSGYEKTYEALGVRKNGEEYPLRLEARNIPYKGKNVRVVEFRDITENKQIEKALQEINEDLKESQRIAHLGSWRLDIASGQVVWSGELYKIFGFDPALPPPPFKESMKLFTPESWDKLSAALNNTIDTVTPYELELETLRKDGSHGWMWVHGKPVTDEKGVTIGLRGAAQDITERKQAEKALRESEETYRLIAENMSDVISILDMDLRFTYVSPSIRRLSGFTVEEAMLLSIEELIMRPEYYKKVVKAFEEEILLEASGTADPYRTRIFEFEQFRRDNSMVWVEAVCSFIRDKEQKPTGLLIISRNIASRKQAEAERDRLMAAIQQVGETIVITNPEGTIQYVNPTFEEVSGYSQKEAMGQNPRVLKSGHQDEIFYRQLWQTISSGKTWSGRMVNQKKDGTLFIEDATISPVCDAAGRIMNYVAVKRDVTEHLRLADQLQQAQKMESVGRLAGGVAHDLNNTLSVILGFTDLAMEKVDPDDPLYNDLSEVLKAANRSTGIVQQLLAFARKQVITPVVLDLNDTVSGMVKMLRRLIGEDITFAWHPGADLWPVMMDPSQVDQILANLCVNARDAIHDVGSITVETKNADIDEDYCLDHAYFKPGEYVLLTVSDTGCGMDPEMIDKIFDPFFTTKETGKGTGLGLSMVYGIVKQNKGFISVYSELEQGTSFAIYLPRHVDKTVQKRTQDPEELSTHGPGTILLVEDEPAILKMLAKMLERLGYHVLATNSPGEAIHLARECKGEIHLLMTDVIMPEMNGRDLARNILSLYPNIRRLFMSGFTADIIARHGVLDAEVHFIHKPFSVKDLATKLREVMRKDNDE